MELNIKKEKGLELWLNGMSLTKASMEVGINRLTLTTYIKERGYTVKNPAKKYNYKSDYFKTIDTETKAYWLGFLYADGCITELKKTLRLELCLQRSDREHLLKFVHEIGGNESMLREKKSVLDGKSYYSTSVSINCTGMCRDLITHGCTPRKSLTLTFPTSVPKELLRHFIRGYVDGDGCIDLSRRRLSILGTEKFLNSLNDYFEELGITRSKLYRKKDNKAFSIEKYGGNAKKILSNLYCNSSVYLDRKFNKAIAVLSSDI